MGGVCPPWPNGAIPGALQDASFRRLRREADSARGIQPITEPHLGLKGSGWRGHPWHRTAEDSPHLLD
ncbi:unnamed protein product [Gadus morhua 'NCC']